MNRTWAAAALLNEKPISQSEWHKNLEVPAVTGFVVGRGPSVCNCLTPEDVWKAGDCDQIRLMTGERRGTGESKRLKCRVCSEKSQLVLGLRIHVPKLWVEVTRSTFRLYLRHCYQGYLSVSQRCLDIYLDDIRGDHLRFLNRILIWSKL